MSKAKLTQNQSSRGLKKTQEQVLSLTGKKQDDLQALFTISSFNAKEISQKNCENLVGSVEIPVGVAGPVGAKLTLLSANHNFSPQNLSHDFLLPLATTEGALVASVNRGCKALRIAKNLQVQVKKIGMTRAPVFGFSSLEKAREFAEWLEMPANYSQIKQVCESTSNHLTLLSLKAWQVGRMVYVRFVFDADQAMGMNMVTIALNKLWQQELEKYPEISLISLSSNLCTDKKFSIINQLLGRGYWVQAEAVLPTQVIQAVLKTSLQAMLKTFLWKNVVGSRLAGSNNLNMHAANMVAALFLATGQDMAHVVESSQADLIYEDCLREMARDGQEHSQSGLRVTLTMPNINVGTVGGGTSLPAFAQARKIIMSSLQSAEKSAEPKTVPESLQPFVLAAATAVGVMAGEISGLAALSSNTLAQAHQELARGGSETKKNKFARKSEKQ